MKVAAERKYRGFRTDEVIGVRQFEVALRKLRQLSSKVEGPLDELDIEETIESTAEKGGLLQLAWTRSRKNTVKVILLMDSGGSMTPHIHICSQLFTAMNRASHFKDLRFYYFHNCIYDYIFLDPYCRLSNTIKTEQFLNLLDQDYKLIIVGDASMAPSELLMINGAIDWNMNNKEPGILWLKRIAAHFHHIVWLNPILEEYWDWTEGYYTIARIKEIFPMYELTVEGLDQLSRSLK